MQVFFRNCTHILTRTQGKKFEDMFLVKIVNKGTSLIIILTLFKTGLTPSASVFLINRKDTRIGMLLFTIACSNVSAISLDESSSDAIVLT